MESKNMNEIIELVKDKKSFIISNTYEFNYSEKYDCWLCYNNVFSIEELLFILGGELMKNKKITYYNREDLI